MPTYHMSKDFSLKVEEGKMKDSLEVKLSDVIGYLLLLRQFTKSPGV